MYGKKTKIKTEIKKKTENKQKSRANGVANYLVAFPSISSTVIVVKTISFVP